MGNDYVYETRMRGTVELWLQPPCLEDGAAVAKCKVDCVSCPTFVKLLRKLSKKYPHIRGDLEAVIPDIEADYMNSCNASRPPKRKLNIEHWKYEFGSTDLRRGPATPSD